jgi:ribosomal protein S18 acetylase RimI-like enzyme
MRRSLDAVLPPIPRLGPFIRHPVPADSDAIAALMLDAYRGTIDFEPTDTLADARKELAGSFAGEAGRFLADASFLAVEEDGVVSASLVTRYEDAPFVAFTMTRADRKGKGLARGLLIRSLHALADARGSHVDLEVTAGNEPAEHLYRSLGFVIVEEW